MNPADIFKLSLGNLFSNRTAKSTPSLGAMQTSSLSSPTPTPAPSKTTVTAGGNSSATTPKQSYVNSQVELQGSMAPSTEATTPSGAVVNTSNGSLVSAPASMSGAGGLQNDYTKAFQTYLSSLQPSEAETQAEKDLSALTLQSKQDQDYALNRPGQTLGFSSGEAARVGRNNAYGIEALSNKVNALTGSRNARTTATKAQLDFEKGLYDDYNTANKPKDFQELSPGATLYDPNTKKALYTAPTAANQNGSGGLGGTSGVLSPLALAVRNGTLTIAQVPAANRARVASELASSGLPSDAETSLNTTLEAVNSLLDDPKVSSISGYVQGKLGLANLDPTAQEAINKYNQLTSLLSLANRQQLKGQGAISDFEFKVLQDASSALGRNLSDAQFKSQLEKIRDVFQGKYRNISATSSADLQPQSGADNDPLGLF